MTQNNFIGEWFLSDPSLCSLLIDFYNSFPNKHEGVIFRRTSDPEIDKTAKDSVDAPISLDLLDKSPISDYVEQLIDIAKKYSKKYPWCDEHSPWGIFEGFNLRKYNPGGGFFKFHCERGSSDLKISARHLVFMTYLNTVSDGGETEFFHQQIKVKPEAGKTLIWPADWTHTHRGIPSPTEEKYIITGWFSYAPCP